MKIRSKMMNIENGIVRGGVAALIAMAAIVALSTTLVEAQEGPKPGQGAAATKPPVDLSKPTTPVTITGREQRYCEVYLVYPTRVDGYGTSGLNDCPAELWKKLDVGEIKKQTGAMAVLVNEPRYTTPDLIVLGVGERVSFGGLEMRWIVGVDPAKAKAESQPYTIFETKKTNKLVFDKGKPVFELVGPDGNTYVMMARVERFPVAKWAKCRDELKHLPTGWSCRTRTLKEELVVDMKPTQTFLVVKDELGQYYNGFPKSK